VIWSVTGRKFRKAIAEALFAFRLATQQVALLLCATTNCIQCIYLFLKQTRKQ